MHNNTSTGPHNYHTTKQHDNLRYTLKCLKYITTNTSHKYIKSCIARCARGLKRTQSQAEFSPPDETSPASIKRMQSQAEASRAPLSRGLSPHRKWRSPHMPQAAFFGLPLGFAFGLTPSLAVCHKVDRQANPHAFSSSQDWQPYRNRQRGQTPRPTPFTAS